MPATPPETTYDVFISYSHADADWVWEWLVPRLKAEGLAVCTDQESFDVGVPSLINMENAVIASRHTLLVLTPGLRGQPVDHVRADPDPDAGSHRPAAADPARAAQAVRAAPRIAMLTYVNLGEGAAVEREFGRLVKAIRGTRRPPDPSPVPAGGPVAPVAATSVAPLVPAPPTPAPEFNTAAVRELLMAAFNDEELTTFCFDTYRAVYENFAAGMSRTQKVQMLVEHCARRGQMAQLLAQVEQANPYQYGRFSSRLRGV